VTLVSKEAVEQNMEKLARVDRVWLLLEADLKNALGHTRTQIYGAGSGSEIPAMVVENGGEYWLTIMRGGHANPLDFVRTEMIRVGYRIEEETLWRDVWYDLASTDVEQARQQKVVENVEEVNVRLLAEGASSYSAGPWQDRWPVQEQGQLPIAIEVTMNFKEFGEITRLYSLVKGE